MRLEARRQVDNEALRTYRPPLIVTGDVVMQQAAAADESNLPPSSPAVSDAGGPVEDDSWTTVVQRGLKKRDELPQELQDRLKKADEAMACFNRVRRPRREPPAYDTMRRVWKPVYFCEIQRGGMARILRFSLQELVTPLDRAGIAYVDFIGADVAEILLDARYERAVMAAMEQRGHKYVKNGSPLMSFATKYRSDKHENRMLVNATKLQQRCERHLERIQHPVVRQFFTDLRNQAQAAIQDAKNKGALVADDVLYPGKRGESTEVGDEGRNNRRAAISAQPDAARSNTSHPSATSGDPGDSRVQTSTTQPTANGPSPAAPSVCQAGQAGGQARGTTAAQ